MNTWLVILCGGLITYLTRLSFFLVADKGGFPDWAIRALRFVPPAVLTALVCQELLIPNGELALSLINPRLIAGAAAVIVAWRTRRALPTIMVGMVLLYILIGLFNH
jgi:branched-subunit amino acid transport protein